MRESYSNPSLRSAFGATVDFNLIYNSYNADGSHARIDTVMGYGWTHSYNIFLFSQRGHMFRMGSDGITTQFRQGPNGMFTATPGWFETLVRNPDGTFTLTQKDQTRFTFAQVANTPFLVGGPVYRLISIVDRNNNVTMLTYVNGVLTQITDTYDRSLVLSYNGQKKLTGITDPLMRTTHLVYDSTGRKLMRVIDPEGKFIQYTYNTLYQMTQKIDKDGRRFSFVYNAQRKPVSVRDGAGQALFTLTNPQNWATDSTALDSRLQREYIPATTSKTDGRGNVWKYDYDKNGYITKLIAPDDAMTSYVYDPATLLVASMTDDNVHTTMYQYDALGNTTKTTNALNHMTTYEYEPVFNMMTKMTDPNMRMTTYEYDARGNRIKETDPLMQMRRWTYDSHGNVMTATDKRGSVTEYEYDASGNLSKMTRDVMGLSIMTTYMHDIVGNLRFRTDDNMHTTEFQYDGLDRIIREIDPMGDMTQTIYDGEGNVIEVIDCNTNSTKHQYDLRKRLMKITDALNQMTMMTYDGNDNRITMTDKNVHTTNYDYDLQNRLIRITDAIGCTSEMTYDGVGNKLSDTDGNIHTTMYEYDELNRLQRRIDPIMKPGGGQCITHFDYDMAGLPGMVPSLGSSLVVKQTDGNSKVIYFGYDALDRMITRLRKEGDVAPVEDGSDARAQYTYDPNDNRLTVAVKIAPMMDLTTMYEYDALNRVIRETNPAGDMTRYEYDGVDNLIRVTAPNGNITTNAYDPKDRLTTVSDLEGPVAGYTYDCVGNRMTETDGNNNTTAYEYDDLYRLIKATDPMGEMTMYEYDPVGNLKKVTDREGRMTTRDYDDIYRLIRTTDALPSMTSYEYDCVGNVTKITDANNHMTLYDYDEMDRLIKETYADPMPNMRVLTYDCVGNVLTRTDQKGQTTTYNYNDLYFLLQRDYPITADDNLTYDLSGRMLTAERGGWPVTFTYDGADRIIQTMQNDKTINYVYDIPGRTRNVTYPGGRMITEQMDFRSRLSTINDATSPPPIVQYMYDAGDRVITRTYRNGTMTSYSYNSNNWILSLEHTRSMARIAGFGHEYDKEGNKKFEEKRLDSAHSEARSEAYQYDAIYRLIDYKVGELAVSTVPMPITQTAYDLDAVGNWNSKTTDGTTETRTHNDVNEITSINANPIAHDDNGNLHEDERYSYDYDEENRLSRVTRAMDSQVVGEYQYDALGRRVVKRGNPGGMLTETRYYHDGLRIIEEQDAGAVTQATYVYGNYIDEVLTMDREAQTSYYHENSLWSVMAITDGMANIVERYSYDAYGCPTITDGLGAPVPANMWGTAHSAIGNPYVFTGRQSDEETGLYYYRARYYDCMKGRFLQRDPLGLRAGMNLYAYVGNGPVNVVDPSGLDEGRVFSSGSNASGPVTATVYPRREMTPDEKKRAEKSEKDAMENFNPERDKELPETWKPFLGGTIEIKFDPSKSKEAICCDEIIHVQVAQIFTYAESSMAWQVAGQGGGSAYLRHSRVVPFGEGRWGHLSGHATPDNYSLDVSPLTGSPVLQASKGAAGEGAPKQQIGWRKTNGQSQPAIAVDSPWLGKGMIAHFQTFPCCRKGRDKGKFYDGGVNWSYDGGRDKEPIVVNAINTPKPNQGSPFMRAYRQYVSKTGIDPCNPR